MKKFLRLIPLLLLPVLSLAQMNPLFVIGAQRHKLLNKQIYDPFIQVPIGHFDIFANNRSFGTQGVQLIDGDIATPFVKGNQVVQQYWPDEEIVNLNGLYAIDRIEIYDVGGGANYIISSGLNQFDSLSLDFNITLDQNTKRVFNFSGKQVRFISLKLNQTAAEVAANPSKRQGPSEIKVFGKAISIDPIPAKVERPKRSFPELFGVNQDITAPSYLYPWSGMHFRAYDNLDKWLDTLPLPGTKYAFNNMYTSNWHYDDSLAAHKAKGIDMFFVLTGLSRPAKLYRPSYVSAGMSDEFDRNGNGAFNVAIQYGADKKNPSSYVIIADAAYQIALHYGCSAVTADTVKAKIDHSRDGYPTKVGTCLSPSIEFGNEEDNWFRETKEGYYPDEFWAKCSALYDGHCGTMGPGYGFKQADPKFKVIMAASADFGLDFIKRGYYWAKKYRADGKLPVDVINVHSYLNSGGGQFVAGATGIAPELYTRDGYAAVGLKQYLDEFGDWIKRYCPGKEIWWTEFGYDSNPYSFVGVPLLTQAQAATAGAPLNSHQVQAALILRSYFEGSATTSIDRMTMFTLYNYGDFNESIQRFKDLNESQAANWSANQYHGDPGEQFASSGLCEGQYCWTKGATSSINVATITTGTNITIALDSLRPYWNFSGVIQLRDPADASGSGAHLYCTVVSQTQTQLVVQVANVGPGGVNHTGTGSFTSWRLDTPYAKKLSWYAVNNTFAVIDTNMRMVRDMTTSEFRHYVYRANGGSKEVHALYLPTQSGDKLRRTVDVGANNAVFKNLESRTGATTTLAVTSNNTTIDITEMPKLIVCNVTGGNAAPVANAGADKAVSTTSTTFTGSGTDSDGTISSYLWSKVSGPSTTLTGTTTTTLSASGLTNGSYVFRLTVTDNLGATGIDDVILTVSGVGVNSSPTANAGADQSITTASTSVIGSGTDSDGSIASYSWSKVSGPNSPTATGGTTTTLSLAGMVNGTYVYRLTVTDNLGATGIDDVSIVVAIPTNNPPAAAFLGSASCTGCTSMDFYDNGSTDPDGDYPLSVSWTLFSGPNTPTLTNANTSHVTVTGMIPGVYKFNETVTDSRGLAGTPAQITATINAGSGNTAPTANAGSDQSIAVSTTTVTGSGTDADGTIASYAWTRVSGPNTPTATGTTTTSLSLSGLITGTYTYRLTVTDNLGATGSDDVNIVVSIGGGGGGLTTATWTSVFVPITFGGATRNVMCHIYKPVGYGNGTNFPMIMFTHGQGEKYQSSQTAAQNLSTLQTAGLPKYLSSGGGSISFVVVCPQIDYVSYDSYNNSVQEPGVLTNAIAAHMAANYSVDPQRFHLTGLSFGGETICASAKYFPTRWATCVPISTAPYAYPDADFCRAVFWWFHGASDTQYPAPANEVAWIDELNNHGVIPFTSHYTIFAGQGHSGTVWDNVYAGTTSGLTLSTGSGVPNNFPAGNIYNFMAQYKIVSGTVQLVGP